MAQIVQRVALGGLIAAAVAAGGAAPPTEAKTAAGKASVAVKSCKTGDSEAARTAVFRAGMKTIGGASRLSVRFRLQERLGADDWSSLAAPGLDRWRISKKGVGAFGYSQRVKALAAGSEYRVVVDYRWQSRSGKVLAKARRTSKPCAQGPALPNLAVKAIAARNVPDRPRQGRYALSVINKGSVPAPASNLKLLVDGSTERRLAVPALAAGQTARVAIVAPRCGATMGAQVDPDGLVRESKETDNFLTRGCTLR